MIEMGERKRIVSWESGLEMKRHSRFDWIYSCRCGITVN